jgi:hypothetical protein
MYPAIVRAERHCVVRGSISVGWLTRCQMSFLTRWMLPNCVHGQVQDEWQGETRLRFKLRGRSAPLCAHCCARMRVKCTRLSIPAATRMCTRCANFQTTVVSRLQQKSWNCRDARVVDVLLGLMHRWRWSGEPYIPVCPLVGRNLSELSAGDLPQEDFWPDILRVRPRGLASRLAVTRPY